MAGTRIVVLFNLKAGQTAESYEAWAKARDLPTVRGLKSIEGFQVFRSEGLLGSDASPPFAYVEVIDVADMAAFGEEVAGATMQAIAAEFQAIAEPVFILTRDIEAGA